MKTDAQRWEDLLAAAATARVRVAKLASDLGRERELAKHIDVALRRLPVRSSATDPPIDDVKDIEVAIAKLVAIAGAAGVDEEVIDAADRARRRLVRATDAFLVDTQVIT
jgi:hypothetical protein